MARSAKLSLLALPLMLPQCARQPSLVEIRGSMETAAGLALTDVAVTALYRTDSGLTRQVSDTTDFAGRFVLTVPAARFVHFTARLGHLDFADRDLVTPPSGTLELKGLERQNTYHILAADSSSPWGHAFNVLGDRGLLDSPRLIVNPDSIEYRANAARALDRSVTAWRTAPEPLIRQARAATLVSRARALQEDGDTAAARILLERTKREFPVLLAALEVSPTVERAGPLAVPRKLPAFSAVTLAGQRREVLDRHVLRAQFTLIDFWATWCVACIEELPVIASEFTSRSRPTFDVISVTFDDNVDEVRAFRGAKQPMPWRHWRLPLAFDDPSARSLGIASLPHAMLVDSAWRVVAQGAAVRGANLKTTLDALQKRTEPASTQAVRSTP